LVRRGTALTLVLGTVAAIIVSHRGVASHPITHRAELRERATLAQMWLADFASAGGSRRATGVVRMGMVAGLCLSTGCASSGPSCGSTVSGSVELRRIRAELDGAEVTACRNDVCQVASLQGLADGEVGEANVFLEVEPPAEPYGGSLDIEARAIADGFTLSFVWLLDAPSAAKPSDRVEVRVTNADGDRLLAASASNGRRDATGCPSVVMSLALE